MRAMDDLAADLQHFLNHEPVCAAAPSPARRFRLWIKRKPAVATLGFAAAFCAAAFVAALAAGYLRTTAALNQAERNAAVADATCRRCSPGLRSSCLRRRTRSCFQPCCPITG